jgi:hypothetical protein
MFAKREKQPELENEAASMSLLNQHEYQKSVLRSIELKDELAAHKDKLAALTLHAERWVGHDAREFVNKRARALPSGIGQLELELVAYKVIEGAQVMAEVEKLRKSDKDSIYSRLHLNDSGDLEFVISLDNARGAVEILNCAVALHDARVTKLRHLAIAAIATALKPRRARIAEKVAQALADLHTALEAEAKFAEELANQDADLAKQLQPGIFPFRILGDPALVYWERQVQRLGLMANLPQPDLGEGQHCQHATAIVSGAGTIAEGTL